MGDVAVSQQAHHECPRCGKQVPRNVWGRPKVWCSGECRRAASAGRRGQDADRVRVVEVERPVQLLTASQAAQVVLDSPKVTGELLEALAAALAAGEVSGRALTELRPGLKALTEQTDSITAQ